MVKRKSLKFLSIALAVVVVGGGLYYGTSRYISADVESDGEWANFKNLTNQEMRTIIFDAYVSNVNLEEDPFVVTKKALVLYDDLSSGTVKKVPVNADERYAYWRTYWDSISDRKPTYSSAFTGKNVAYAAEVSKRNTLKDQFIARVISIKDANTREKYITALSSVTAKIDAGQITSIPSDETEFAQMMRTEYERGVVIESFAHLDAGSYAGSGTNFEGLSDKHAFNVAMNKMDDVLGALTVKDTGLSANALKQTYALEYVRNQSKVPAPSSEYVKTILVGLTQENLKRISTKLDSATNAVADVVGGVSAVAFNLPKLKTEDNQETNPYTGNTEGDVVSIGGSARASSASLETTKNVSLSWYAPEYYGMVAYQQAVMFQKYLNAINGTSLITKPEVANTAVAANAATRASVEQAYNVTKYLNSLQNQQWVDRYMASIGSNAETVSSEAGSGMVSTGWSGAGTVGINPNTGKFEYKSIISHNGTDVGYMSFDPSNAKTDAQLHYVFSGKKVSLYADPTTGDIYLEIGSSNGDPLYAIGESIDVTEVGLDENGNIAKAVAKKRVNGLMSVVVAKDGSIGGSFKYMGRVFNYNPNSKAFEIPVNIDNGFKLGDDSGSKTIYLDSKGGVRGNVSVIKSGASTGNLYFTRTGTVGFTYNYAELDKAGRAIGSLGAVSIDSTGSLAGTVNAGKLTGLKTNLFIGFDNTGISSVNVPIGNIAGNAIGFTYSRDGISLGSFISVSGIPIPVSIGQDKYGGWTVSLPFIGSILKFGQNTDESPEPPKPVLTEDGSIDLDYIHIGRYETSRWFKTYRFYQVQPVQLDKAEMFERADIIFDKYNEHLKRNPSLEEFIHWYIYWGHMKIGTECRNMDEGGHQARVTQLKAALDGLITQNAWHLPEGAEFLDKNKSEYECVKLITEKAATGKTDVDFTKCEDRPENIMGSNPLSQEAENGATTDTDYDSIKEFLDYIEELAKTDPEIERIIQEFINNHEENPTTGLIGDGETIRFTNGFSTFTVPEYDQVVLKKIADSATATVTPTASATTSASATATTSSTATATPITSAKLGYVDTAPFTNKGLEIFQYSAASANKWLSTANGDSIPYMKAGTGYYIYNPGTTVGAEIQKADIVETASLKPSLQKGWNLVANSGEKSLNLGEIKHSIVAGNDKTLVEMAKADEVHNRMYLIQDGTATEATKAFKLLNPLATDITQQIVASLKPYWVYVK